MVNNYINLVVLGNFNPSILTHNFLTAVCGFDLGGNPTKENPPIPVLSSLEYGDVSFFADLGRLQITQKNCTKPRQSKLPRYLATYLEKLPYTPITRGGANFSYNMEVEELRLSQIEQKLLNNRQYFCGALNAPEIQLEVSFSVDDKTEIVKKWILRTVAQSGEASTTMTVQPAEDSKIRIDFNYELNLEKRCDQLTNITRDYASVYDIFLSQFKKIFEGKIS